MKINKHRIKYLSMCFCALPEGAPEGGSGGGGEPEPQGKPEAKFTQAELDKIVQTRLSKIIFLLLCYTNLINYL